MASSVKVNSRICGFKHQINGQLEGKEIITDIQTDCAKVAKMSHMEIPKKQTLNIKENYAMDKAKDTCCSMCIVPAAVMYVCKLETGMISPNLAKKAGTVDIDFNED
ncbi:MAG: hypothetical protein R2741_08960 [Methanolobus sp.]